MMEEEIPLRKLEAVMHDEDDEKPDITGIVKLSRNYWSKLSVLFFKRKGI